MHFLLFQNPSSGKWRGKIRWCSIHNMAEKSPLANLPSVDSVLAQLKNVEKIYLQFLKAHLTWSFINAQKVHSNKSILPSKPRSKCLSGRRLVLSGYFMCLKYVPMSLVSKGENTWKNHGLGEVMKHFSFQSLCISHDIKWE